MESSLYEKHFDKNIWGHEEKLSELKASISSINKRAELFLSRIANEFPQLTDHSIDHSLMLWNYLDIVLDDKQESRLTPLEAYVLHIAFLVHDSGTCISVLDRQSTIETDQIYQDYLATYGDDDNTKKRSSVLFHSPQAW